VKLTVLGLAQTQGNKSAFPFRRKDGSLGVAVTEGRRPESRAAFKEWRGAVAACARLWLEQNGSPAPLSGPVAVTMTFYLPRPKSAPKRVLYPIARPDLLKLGRAVEDALKGLAWNDDSQNVDIMLRKRFAVDSPPRVEIEIFEKRPSLG
jgi:Holliday junction resolvase RusA-like endonuclease